MIRVDLVALHDGIRGVHASASLKAIALQEESGALHRGIRGVHASASLKGDRVPAMIDVVSGHPRRSCLGLIEGVIEGSADLLISIRIRGVHASASLKDWIARAAGCRSGRIRGVHASASLKGRHRSVGGGGRGGHPRRSCLGLIEGSRPPCTTKPGATRIRGVHASASLKGRHRPLRQREQAGIRGVHASASLKVDGHGRSSSGSDGASEAFMPRPH